MKVSGSRQATPIPCRRALALLKKQDIKKPCIEGCNKIKYQWKVGEAIYIASFSKSFEMFSNQSVQKFSPNNSDLIKENQETEINFIFNAGSETMVINECSRKFTVCIKRDYLCLQFKVGENCLKNWEIKFTKHL